jgi:hypothetical protein
MFPFARLIKEILGTRIRIALKNSTATFAQLPYILVRVLSKFQDSVVAMGFKTEGSEFESR